MRSENNLHEKSPEKIQNGSEHEVEDITSTQNMITDTRARGQSNGKIINVLNATTKLDLSYY